MNATAHENVTEGRCLCGGVRLRVRDLPDEISACHCTYCTRFGGGLQMGIEVPVANTEVSGPVKTHRSTVLAERAWCDTCGSALWMRSVEGDDAELLWVSPGLFDNAGGGRLVRVVYADRHPDGFWLEGAEVERVSRAEYEAREAHIAEGAA